jgi:hypothetical protein
MLNLWLQTIGALLALGVAGWSVIWVFRNPQRPFLWLAAPLVGLPLLGGVVQILYYALSTRLSTAVWAGWVSLAALSIVCVVRAWRPQISRKHLIAAAVTVLIASVWAVYVCNHSAIRAGEPTIMVTDGSDMFGYAMVGDWLATRTGAQLPRHDEVLEALQYANLFVDGSRGNTFFLTAIAGWWRETTSLFSYDWFSGVVLAAAAMGFTGLFATRRSTLWLLLLVALSTAWLTVARTGFLGKTLAYPCALMLVAFYVEAWTRPSRLKILTACLCAPFAAFLVNPLLPFLVLTLACGGTVFSTLLVRWWNGKQEQNDEKQEAPVGRLLFRAVALWAGMGLPAFVAHRIFYEAWYPPYRTPWDFAIPVSLDLESPALALVGTPWTHVLSALFMLVILALSWMALRARNREALACLACAGLVPLAFVLGQSGLYGFHGLIYPMTAAGAALLVGSSASLAPPILLGLLVVLHVPQIWHSWHRYVLGKHYLVIVHTQSEANKLKRRVKGGDVDVCTSHYADTHLVLAELLVAGVKVHLRSPSWETSLADWAKSAGCPPPTLPPKSKYTINELRAFSPPGTKRMSTSRLKLSEDQNAVAILGIRTSRPDAYRSFEGGRTSYWLDDQPAVVEIHNGTGAKVSTALRMRAAPNPARGEVDEILFEVQDQQGRIPLPKTDGSAVVDLPLELQSGTTMIKLWVPGNNARKDMPSLTPGEGDLLVDRVQLVTKETAGKQE